MEVIKINVSFWTYLGEHPDFIGILEDSDGDKSWCLNGKFHREDGPAVEFANGDKSWWLNGKCHREDGPAVEWANGSKAWHLNGKFHREDGPAIERADGSKSWFLNGIKLTENEWKLKMRKKKMKKLIEEINGSN